jgi:uncharacterized damage-inducible protein DinB
MFNRTLGLLALAALTTFGVASTPRSAFAQDPELGQGWLPEFTLCAKHLVQLAEATPAEKFSWRPAPGVRSISEVYMHLAAGNFWLLGQAGVKVDLASLPKDPEKSVTAKADVIKWLKQSLELVKTSYETADRQKKVQFFNRETTADGVFLRILAHNNEHMGQSIAYARMNGVVPPWSQ